MSEDVVNHPKHYESCGRNGFQPIDLIEHYPFALGSAMKYLFRAGKKEGNSTELDLSKARWYLRRAVARKNFWQAFVQVDRRESERAMSAKKSLIDSVDDVSPYLKMLFSDSDCSASVTVRSVHLVIRALDEELGKDEQ